MDLFRHPHYLGWAAFALIGARLFGAWSEKRRDRIARRFADAGLLARLSPPWVGTSRALRYRLAAAGLCMLLLALAAPQWGVELVKARGKATQVIIAVDTSLSMLAEDLKPNRMNKAKSALGLLIDELKGDRIGLIAFAGSAYIQCPLTTDTQAVKSFLHRMTVGMLPEPGTALGEAVGLAARRLKKYPGHKALILLTDGEDHGENALEAAKEAAREGIHIYVIGMGSPEGEPIPIKNSAGEITGYKKDAKGETVVSRLGEAGLIELAEAASGAYYRATPLENEVGEIVSLIRGLEKVETDGGAQNRFKNRFRFPLGAAVLLLFLELIAPLRRPALRAAAVPANLPLTAALILSLASGCGFPSDLSLKRGNSRYAAEEFEPALRSYARADSGDAKTPFNTGAAKYKLGSFEEARDVYEAMTENPDVPEKMAPKVFYNLGNSRFRLGDMEGAADAYRRCLMLDPGDEDCRHNLVLALRPPPPKKKDDKKDGGGDDNKKDPEEKEPPPDPANPTPQDSKRRQGLSKEDAKRILQALKEREKSAEQTAPPRRLNQKPPQDRQEEDW